MQKQILDLVARGAAQGSSPVQETPEWYASGAFYLHVNDIHAETLDRVTASVGPLGGGPGAPITLAVGDIYPPETLKVRLTLTLEAHDREAGVYVPLATEEIFLTLPFGLTSVFPPTLIKYLQNKPLFSAGVMPLPSEWRITWAIKQAPFIAVNASPGFEVGGHVQDAGAGGAFVYAEWAGRLDMGVTADLRK